MMAGLAGAHNMFSLARPQPDIHERAYEIPLNIWYFHKHTIYVPKSSILMNTTSINGFLYIYESAYETPQYGNNNPGIWS
jgi:hypothetical protein